MPWLPTEVTVAPTAEPVSLDEAKEFARIDASEDNALVTSLIAAARSHVEQRTGTKLMPQTVLMRARDWGDLYALPVAPLTSVTSVEYLDASGVEQTLSTDVYEVVLAGLSPSIQLKVNQTWPSALFRTDAIRITAVAGYASLPPEVTTAIMRLVTMFYDNRSISVEDPLLDALLVNHRLY
jgi:uncharacterized phiE125 gp8 family phage protein